MKKGDPETRVEWCTNSVKAATTKFCPDDEYDLGTWQELENHAILDERLSGMSRILGTMHSVHLKEAGDMLEWGTARRT